MGLGYELAYRFGITPWERAGSAGQDQLQALFEREQSAPTRALDLGCGRGTHSLQLAERGWDVTGVDFIPRAVVAARRRATDAGLKATFVVGDVTDLPASVGSGFRFVLDIGCFHGLADQQRLRYGQQLDSVTEPGAGLLILTFAPGGRGPLPRGADHNDLCRALPRWSIVDRQPADTSGMPRPLRSRAPMFYRLSRSIDRDDDKN